MSRNNPQRRHNASPGLTRIGWPSRHAKPPGPDTDPEPPFAADRGPARGGAARGRGIGPDRRAIVGSIDQAKVNAGLVEILPAMVTAADSSRPCPWPCSSRPWHRSGPLGDRRRHRPGEGQRGPGGRPAGRGHRGRFVEVLRVAVHLAAVASVRTAGRSSAASTSGRSTRAWWTSCRSS